MRALPPARALRSLILLFGILGLAACDSDSEHGGSEFLGLLAERGSFTILDEALQETNLSAGLEQGGPYTLFAPTDQAFQLLGAGTLEMLRDPANRNILAKVLNAHIVPRPVPIDEFRDGDRLVTLDGSELEVRVERGRVTVGGLEVRRALQASNGLVYSVGEVFRDHLTIAERLTISGSLRTMRRVLEGSDQLDMLHGAGPFTAFVPLDDAFESLGSGAVARLLENPALLLRVASNHIVRGALNSGDIEDGQTVTSEAGASLTFGVGPNRLEVEGVRVLLPDIQASNGVIHLVAGALTSDLNLNEAATLAGLSLWLDAVSTAGLAALLEGEDPYTVFAPANRAFTLAGGAAQIAFMQSEGLLQDVLEFHIVRGRFSLAELEQQAFLSTVQGDEMRIVFANGQARVGLDVLAGVIRSDIVAKNGIIHVIDVLLSPRLNLLEALVFNRHTRFVRGVHLAGLDADYETGGPFTVFAFTDAAFNADPELLALLDPSRVQQLQDYLNYHTGDGDYPYEVLVKGKGELPTRYGVPLTYVNTAAGLFADTTQLIPMAPVLTNPSNGTLYRLDGVLTPPD